MKETIGTIMHNLMMVVIVITCLRVLNNQTKEESRPIGSRRFAALFSFLLFVSSIYCAIWGR